MERIVPSNLPDPLRCMQHGDYHAREGCQACRDEAKSDLEEQRRQHFALHGNKAAYVVYLDYTSGKYTLKPWDGVRLDQLAEGSLHPMIWWRDEAAGQTS